MKGFSLYDEPALRRLADLQRERAWDLEKSIAWDTPIDTSKPLVPLDEGAILFPGASKEERLVISQMMGLIIAASIYELEECLIRIRQECWDSIHRRFPVGPEMAELGDLFFVEEEKHSRVFRRYIERFAQALGLPLDALLSLLPRVKDTRSEFLIKQDLQSGGHAFWWIVALVEQEFLLLYHVFRPFQQMLEPLYFSLHQKHFEEEARHSPFPYLVIELATERGTTPWHALRAKTSLAAAQLVQSAWAMSSLSRIRLIKDLKSVHPFFSTLAGALPRFEEVPQGKKFWKLMTSAPYISSFLNSTAHRRVLQFARDNGSLAIPFPEYEHKKLVKY